MKVLITRPQPEAARLAAALTARGFEPVVEPLLDIRFFPEGGAQLQPALRGAQAVIFTSANGVRAFAAATPTRSIPAFAVGPATARAARDAGFPLVMSAAGTVGALARLVIDRVRPEGGALIHAAARDRAGDLAGSLRAAGFTFRRVVLYEAVAATGLGAAAVAALTQREMVAAFFFSPRTAATFVRLVDAAGLGDACRNASAIVASAAVAQALAPLVWGQVRIAAAPTEPALVAALEWLATPADSAGRQEAPV